MSSFVRNKVGVTIIVLLVILAVGQAYLFYQLYAHGTPSNAQMLSTNGATIPAGSGEVVTGPSAGTGIETVYGTVVSAGGGSVVVNMDGTQKTLSVTSKTSILLQGKPKPFAEFQKDLAAYNAQYAELLKDRDANKTAIESLAQPSYYSTTNISLSDLKAGDEITSSVVSGTTVSITKLPAGTLSSTP